jgi:hypothetical protein
LTPKTHTAQGSFFGPYTPLQQLDILAAYATKSYVVGSTNSLLLQQKEKYSDILINLDESNSITVTSPSLRTALALSAADRRWIDFITQQVLDTWDPENPSRPKNHGYMGSEDSIRGQFESYILSLLSAMAYQLYHESLEKNDIPASVANIPDTFPDPGDNAGDFNPEFLAMWRSTHNFELWNRVTEGNRIFDIIEPRHPTAGAFSVEDLQRRFAQGMAEWHIDERVREGREVVGRTWQSGRERVEAGLRGVWAEVEKARAHRQAKRRSRDASREPESAATTTTRVSLNHESSTSSWMVVDHDTAISSTSTAAPPPSSSSTPSTTSSSAWTSSLRDRAAKVDTAQLQASARESAAKAGAYFSSWGTWAKERMAQNQQSNTGRASSTTDNDGGGRVDDHDGGMETSRPPR